MSKIRTIALVGAIGCAVVAGLMVRNVLNRKQEVKQDVVNVVQTSDVLVASKDILMGDKLGDGAVIWKAWPKDNLLPSMITRDAKPNALTDMAQARARIPFYKDEPILDKKIVQPGSNGYMAAILPKGMRAIAVSISDRSSAGYFILPNDRVDVIVTTKNKVQTGNEPPVKSDTVLQDVKVLAISQVFRQSTEGDQSTNVKGATATLELTPEQAVVISSASSSGELSLALRSLAEDEGKDPKDIAPVLGDKFKARTGAGAGVVVIRGGVATATSN